MPLSDQLVAFWKLDEAGGTTRNDSVGTNHLTDVNGVAQVAGKIGDAAQFVRANAEYLTIDDNPALSMGAGVRFTFGAWVWPDTLTGVAPIISKFGSSFDYHLDVNTATPRFFCGGTGLTYGSPISVSAWHLIIAWYDGAVMGLQVDNGAVSSQAHSTDAPDGTAVFRIGSRGDAPQYWDGRIDAAFVAKRAWTPADRAEFWNGGTGLELPVPPSLMGDLWDTSVTALGQLRTAEAQGNRREVIDQHGLREVELDDKVQE